MRRAFGDRRFEVGGHAHRQRVDGKARRPAGVEGFAASSGIARAAAPCRRSARRCPSARAAASRGSAATARASGSGVGGRDAAFRRFAADVDLDADVERRQVPAGRDRDEALRDRAAGRSSAPRRSAAAATRALLPCSGPIRCHSTPGEVGGRVHLRGGLLHVVLAERTLPERMRRRAPRPARNVLLTASSGDRAAGRARPRAAARAMRAFTACQSSRSRS